MKASIITLLMAAGALTSAAQRQDAGFMRIDALWPATNVIGSDATAFGQRAAAMYDQANPIATIDQIRQARKLPGLSAEEKDYLDYLLTFALTEGRGSEWFRYPEHFQTSPHRADLDVLVSNVILQSGYTALANDMYEHIAAEAITPSLLPNYLYHKAYALLCIGEKDRAFVVFSNPDLAGDATYGNAARFYRGYVHYLDRDYAAARADFAAVNANTRPGNMAAYYVAQMDYAEGRYEAALRAARQLLARRDMPDEYVAEVNHIVGECLYQQGDFSGAIPYLRKYADAVNKPELSSLYILGVAEYGEGNYGEAVKRLTPVSSQDSPMGQSAYLYIGQAFLRDGDYDQAMMAFNRSMAMNHDPSVTEAAHYNYAVARSHGGKMPFASSVTTFEDFLKRYPDSKYADEVGRYIVEGYIVEDNYEAALQAVNTLHHPSNEILAAKQKVLYALGARSLSAGGDAQRAVELLTEAEKLGKYDAATALETTLALGEAYYRTGDIDKAAANLLDYIGRASATAENMPVARYDLGYARMAQKDWANAAANFERVLSAPGNLGKPAQADAAARLGDARYYQSNWAGAAEAYAKSAALNPAAADYALFSKAMMEGYSKNYNAKISTLDKLIKDLPTSATVPDALLEQADAYIALQKPDKATEVWKKLIKDYGRMAQGRVAALNLAQLQVAEGDVDKAVATYEALISGTPASEEARLASEALRRLQADRGDLAAYDNFVSNVDGMTSLDNEEADHLSWVAATKAYDAGRGTKLLEKYVKDYPSGRNAAEALGMLIDAAEEADNTDAAYAYAKVLVDKFPGAPETEYALQVIGETDYERDRTLDALRAWEQLDETASTVETRNVARMGIMRAARDMGNADKMLAAADALLASSTIGSEEKTEAAFTRALALDQKGRKAEALKIWKELSVNTDDLYGAKSAVYAATALLTPETAQEAATLAENFVNSATPHTYWLARGFIVLSDAYKALGRDFEAREYIKALRDNYPGDEPDILEMIEFRLGN